jgi:hypothetical protein
MKRARYATISAVSSPTGRIISAGSAYPYCALVSTILATRGAGAYGAGIAQADRVRVLHADGAVYVVERAPARPQHLVTRAPDGVCGPVRLHRDVRGAACELELVLRVLRCALAAVRERRAHELAVRAQLDERADGWESAQEHVERGRLGRLERAQAGVARCARIGGGLAPPERVDVVLFLVVQVRLGGKARAGGGPLPLVAL